jgi:hypothetical protein
LLQQFPLGTVVEVLHYFHKANSVASWTALFAVAVVAVVGSLVSLEVERALDDLELVFQAYWQLEGIRL